MHSDHIFDNSLMIQIMLERLKSGSANTQKLVIAIREAVAKALAVYSGSVSSISKVKQVSARLKKELKPVLTIYSDQLLDDVIQTAVIMADAEFMGFQSLFNGINQPDKDKIIKEVQSIPISLASWNGALFLSKFIGSWVNSSIQQVENQVILNMSANGDVSSLQSSINGTSIEPLIVAAAVVGRIARNYQVIAKTAMQHAHSVAASDFYQDNPDLIKYEEFSAILDNKTSAVCRALSGNRYPLGEGPKPPLHPNCRSRLLPVLDEKYAQLMAIKPIGRSEWGEETYYEWLSRQSSKRQDIILGKARGKLFRDGGLTPKQFAQLQLDRNFKPMTLSELKRVIPDAFDNANIDIS